MALQEPAILFLIFQHLPPQDLIIAQRVCCTWRSTITCDNRLLAMLWLRPSAETASPACPPELNPILKHHFPYFFHPSPQLDMSLQNGNENLGPWMCAAMLSKQRDAHRPVKDMPRLKSYLYPEASWRRMIPCRPSPQELQFDMHSLGGGGQLCGTLRCLNFERFQTRHGVDEEHEAEPDRWLTFGLLYDVLEAVWFRGNPKPITCALVDFSYLTPKVSPSPGDIARYRKAFKTNYPVDPRVAVQAQVEHLRQISGPGRVLVSLTVDQRSTEQRIETRTEGKITRHRMERKQCVYGGGWQLVQPFKSMIFTDELHVPGGAELCDVQWDEVYEYGSPAVVQIEPAQQKQQGGHLAGLLRRFRRWRRAAR